MMRRTCTICMAVLGVLTCSGCSKEREKVELPAVATDYIKQLELIETALSRVQDVPSAQECVRSLEAIGPASRLAHERYRAWSGGQGNTETAGEAIMRNAAVAEADVRVMDQVRRIIKKPDLMVIVKPALKNLGSVFVSALAK